MKGFKDKLRQNAYLRWILLFSNWLFQGIIHADKTEKIYKLLFTIISWGGFFILLNSTFNYSTGLSIFLGFLLGHTLNWLVNSNFYNLLVHRLYLSKLTKKDLFIYLHNLSNRLNGKSSILYCASFGSICNGNLNASSDLDVSLVRKPGFKNGLRSIIILVRERKLADLKGIPLEVFLSDSPNNSKKRFSNEQNPVVIYDPDNIIDNYYSQKLSLNQAKSLNSMMDSAKKRIVLFTEFLFPPYDEGIKKTAHNLFIELDANYDLLVYCRKGFNGKENVKTVNTNKLFYSKSISDRIKYFKPDVIIYLPFASATFASFLRMRNISGYYASAQKIMIALQPKPINKWQHTIIKFIKPELVLTPSPELKQFLDSSNISNRLLPLYTDLNRFKPLLSETSKIKLREKYNLPKDRFIISHIGHLNEGRNLLSLIPLQRSGYQVVIIGSSSTPIDSLGSDSLRNKLIDAGIIVIDDYLDKIEEIYQLSDLYIFPVISKAGSIGLPLSILEARSCGIPVLTTDFGSIRNFLYDDYEAIYYLSPQDFLSAVKMIKEKQSYSYSKTRVSQLNKEYFNIIYEAIG